MNVSTREAANGKTIALGLTHHRTHLCCLAEFLKYFPELADLFHENERQLKAVDRAIAEQDIVIQSFNETVKKLCETANSLAQNPHVVRS